MIAAEGIVDVALAELTDRGYAVLPGLFDDDELARVEAACELAQHRLVRGELGERFGTTTLVDDSDGAHAARFANYVTHLTEVVPQATAVARHPTLVALVGRYLGPTAWLLESERFGVVYQDARPGRESSYTRIGWHSDWQSGPHLDIWPSVAFTLHLDDTSPANGFLRVVPGSHRWSTPAPFVNVNGSLLPAGSAPAAGHGSEPPPLPMPLGFDKVPGEAALYCDRGDLLVHDAYLWHSAARATDDHSRRRHVRGGWYSGLPLQAGSPGVEAFVKNAAR